jgi:DNA primase
MTIELLKNRIDLHDLAGRLGLKRPGGKGNYKSPHHDDKTPSSEFQ